MTDPLRRFMLNREIAIEARRIAHAATKTCRYESESIDHDDEHTPKCNKLKYEIEALAMQVKLASMQQSKRRDEQRAASAVPEPANLNIEDRHK